MVAPCRVMATGVFDRSEEHTSELQALRHLVCRLLLEKKQHLIAGIDLPLDIHHLDDAQDFAARPHRHAHHGTSGDEETFFLMMRQPPRSTLFPYAPLFR